MASVYHALHDGPMFSRRKDYCGFGIIAQDDADHKRLRNLGKQIVKGVYPRATDQRAEYNFWLTFTRPGLFSKKHKNLKPFAWADYRGGALQERSTSDAAASLIRDLAEADAIIIFADANAMQTKEADRTRREIKRLGVILTDAVTRRETAVPVVIAFTKADLLRTSTLDAELLEHFGSMVDVISASEKIVATYLCVACGTTSLNLYTPLLFVLAWNIHIQHHELKLKIQDLEKKASKAQKRCKQYEDEAGEWGGLKGLVNAGASIFTGEKSLWKKEIEARERSEALLRDAKQQTRDLQPYVEPAKAALDMCNGLPLIGNHRVLRDI